MKILTRFFIAALTVLPLLVTAADSVNINTASAEELAQLNGIGDTRAEAIVEYRNEKGKFTSVEELTEVSGIGAATLEKNRDLLTAGE